MVNRQRLSDEFARLAAINSPPLHENAIARYLVGRLENLGAEVLFDNAAVNKHLPIGTQDIACIFHVQIVSTTNRAHG